MEKIISTCPACTHKKGMLRYEISAREVAQKRVNAKREKNKYQKIRKALEKQWGNKSAKVVQCTECAYTYTIPYIGGSKEYFSAIYDNNQYPKWREEYNQALEIAKKEKVKKALEIGAGNGNFSEVLAKRIGHQHTYCTEYSQESINILQKKKLQTITDMSKEKNIDFVTLFSVIPYMATDEKLFKDLYRITSKDTNIIISIIADEVTKYVDKEYGIGAYPPDALGQWNQESLTRLLKRTGFRIEKKYTYPYTKKQLIKDIAFGLYAKNNKEEGTISYKIYMIQNKIIRRALSMIPIGYYTLKVLLKKTPKLSRIEVYHIKKNL